MPVIFANQNFFIMKNDFFIRFKATLSEKQTSNKAVRFDELRNLDGDVLLRSVYLPATQLHQIKCTNKSKREFELSIPEWLWNQKLEDEQSRQVDNSGFDQMAKMMSMDAPSRVYPEPSTDRLANEG